MLLKGAAVFPLNAKEVRTGIDALTGKEGDGVLLVLPDGRERFLLWKSLKQYITMELASTGKAKSPDARPVNGPPTAVPVGVGK